VPKPTDRSIPDRQLTIGECLAIARYGTNELDERPMTLAQTLDLLDRLEVCTTCGWSVHIHVANPGGNAVLNVCGDYTNRL